MTRGIGFGPKNTIPRDRVAKRVVYDDSDHYIPDVKSTTFCYSTRPLPTRSVALLPAKVLRDPNFKDLTGNRFGNFEVVGLFDSDRFNRWVVRCCCGNYEIRTTSTLNKMTNALDANRCQSCVDLERIRARDYFNEHGHYPWQIGSRK